jgi:hypothetical protein
VISLTAVSTLLFKSVSFRFSIVIFLCATPVLILRMAVTSYSRWRRREIDKGGKKGISMLQADSSAWR